jgi:hypothetical protein
MLPEGWFLEHDIVMYRNLIKQVPDNSTIIEVGVWKGRSLCSISDLIIKKNLKVIAVDTFTGTPEEHKNIVPEHLLNEFSDNLAKFEIKNHVTIHVGTFQDFYENNSRITNVSCIYLDADHSTEAVKKDIETALKIKEKNNYVIIAGHDADWKSVQAALPSSAILCNKTWKFYRKSTCAIMSTKGRTYSSLPISLTAVINQTIPPDEIVIFDDNEEQKDLRLDPLYSNLFALAYYKGLDIKVIHGLKKGQVYNYQRIKEVTKCELIWRVDDDLIPAPDSLELLKKEYIKDKVIGGYINNKIEDFGVSTSLKIKDTYCKINSQWIRSYKKDINADHLYSSYIYQKNIGHYENLSPLCFREETIHTLTAKYKNKQTLIYLPSVESIHLGDSLGRFNDKELVEYCKYQDEQIFKHTVNNLGLSFKNYYILNSGIGDHFAFISAVIKSNKEHIFKDSIFYVCYPEAFKSICNVVELKSIGEARFFNLNFDRHNIYKFMSNNKWNDNIVDAYIKMYGW